MRLSALLIALLLIAPAWAEPAGLDLRRRVEDFVVARSGVPRELVAVPDLEGFAPILEPGRPVDARLSVNPHERFDGTTPVTVSLRVDGREVHRGSVSVVVRRERRVLVAARPLRPRVPIRPEDLELASVASRGLPRDTVVDPALVVGQQPTRFVAAGAPLRSSQVKPAPLVRRGERVLLFASRGGLRIEATGRAREDGGLGDQVRVQNTDSRREVVGTVAAHGVVHVSF